MDFAALSSCENCPTKIQSNLCLCRLPDVVLVNFALPPRRPPDLHRPDPLLLAHPKVALSDFGGGVVDDDDRQSPIYTLGAEEAASLIVPSFFPVAARRF